jgi:nucleoside-diphosphate-sugar epimerase
MDNRIIEEDTKQILSTDLPWSDLMGRTVAVTGANGLVPAYIVETLLFFNRTVAQKDKVTVLAMVRNPASTIARFAHHNAVPELTVLPVDLAMPLHYDGPIDIIVHGASPAVPRVYTKTPSELFIANGLGTFHLLSLARQKKTEQFLFLSSGEVYGQVDPSKYPQNENTFGEIDPMRLRSCYAESKRFAENMCASLQVEFGVPSKVARLCHTFGPGVRLDDGRVYADFLRNIIDGGAIQLKSDGKAERTFCYLADATEALFTILFKGVAGEAYNVAPPDSLTSIGKLAELLAASYSEGKIDRPEPVAKAPAPNVPGAEVWPAGEADVSKLLSLGWRQKTSLLDSFDRTLRWLQG